MNLKRRNKNYIRGGSYAFLPVLLLILSVTLFAQEEAKPPEKPPEKPLRISTQEEVEVDYKSAPCKNEDRLNAVKALFEKMGAKPEEITTEKIKDVENVVVRIQGTGNTTDKVIIGAHYDKVKDGCGAIDNWTGIVSVAHLYRTVKDLSVKKNFIFVAFGKEELGLIGSRAMADSIKKEERTQYCAMVNIDSLGTAVPQVADNMSSKKLEELATGLAKEMSMPYSHAPISGADSDSSPFISKKIPGVTIVGMSNDWPKILHTPNDQATKINPASVYLGYRLALAMIARIDAADCQSFR